jgi:hypothetical protein
MILKICRLAPEHVCMLTIALGCDYDESKFLAEAWDIYDQRDTIINLWIV